MWIRARKGALKRRVVRSLLTPFGRDLQPERWIFVVGCYNSGTTLLRDLLGRHRDIACLPSEGVRLTDGLPRPEDFGWHRMWCRCLDEVRLEPGAHMEERAARVRRQWSLALPRRTANVLEKSIVNTARLPFLQDRFTPAWFVHLVRNGYAVAEGIRRKAEPSRFGRDEFGNRYPLALCAEQWRESVEIVERDRPGVQRLLEVRYEDLAAEPVAVLERITDFLGLPPLPADSGDGTFLIHGVRSEIRDMNADSLGRLSGADMDEIAAVAGPALDRYGYVRP